MHVRMNMSSASGNCVVLWHQKLQGRAIQSKTDRRILLRWFSGSTCQSPFIIFESVENRKRTIIHSSNKDTTYAVLRIIELDSHGNDCSFVYFSILEFGFKRNERSNCSISSYCKKTEFSTDYQNHFLINLLCILIHYFKCKLLLRDKIFIVPVLRSSK